MSGKRSEILNVAYVLSCFAAGIYITIAAWRDGQGLLFSPIMGVIAFMAVAFALAQR